MKRNIIILGVFLLSLHCYARIPSVQEAQRHLESNLNNSWAALEADALQTEAGRRHLYDTYFIKLTGIPQSPIAVYDDGNIIAGRESDRAVDVLLDCSEMQLLKNHIDANFDSIAYVKIWGEYNYGNGVSHLKYFLAQSYVRTHTQIHNDLLYYKYSFQVTIYERKGSTGQTRVYKVETEDVPYNPYTNKFERGSWRPREESMKKMRNYIMQVYTARELVSILGLLEPMRQEYKRTLSSSESQAELANNIIVSAGPILPHNSAIEDKYNKNMFGDMSAQVQKLPSSYIQSPEYPGGDEEIETYVLRNLKYPNSVQKNGLSEGVTYILTISKNGTVKDVVAENSYLNYELQNQTIQLLKKLPKKFTPASGLGQNIESKYRVYLTYKLSPALQLEKDTITLPSYKYDAKIHVKARKDWTISKQPTNTSITAYRENDYVVLSCKAREERDYDDISDKIIVSTTDNSASYTISFTQKGAPRPFIKFSPGIVVIPRAGTPQTVKVRSNRQWVVSNPNIDPIFKFTSSKNEITISAPRYFGKNDRSTIYRVMTKDGEFSTDLKVYQNGRDSEKKKSGSSSTSYSSIYQDYFERNGKFGLTYFNMRLGVGCTIEEPALYIPLNAEALAVRLHLVELSLIHFRADFGIDGFEGMAWEPQVRFLLPINDQWAILPYAGPTWWLNGYNTSQTKWSFSAGVIARISWGKAGYTDLSVGYHGGENGGISIGASIGFSKGFAK